MYCVEKIGDADNEETGSEGDLYGIHSKTKHQPYRVSLKIDRELMEMEIDTGASLSIMSEEEFRNLVHYLQMM